MRNFFVDVVISQFELECVLLLCQRGGRPHTSSHLSAATKIGSPNLTVIGVGCLGSGCTLGSCRDALRTED